MLPSSCSASWSMNANTLSLAVRPFCKSSFIRDNRRSGLNSISSAAKKELNSATVICPAAAWSAAAYTIMPSTIAVIRLIAGVPTAEAATNFMPARRLALALFPNFSPSCSCPEKILMMRCAAMASLSVWCRSAMESCTSRLILRRRERRNSNTSKITGPARNATSVSNQSI